MGIRKITFRYAIRKRKPKKKKKKKEATKNVEETEEIRKGELIPALDGRGPRCRIEHPKWGGGGRRSKKSPPIFHFEFFLTTRCTSPSPFLSPVK